MRVSALTTTTAGEGKRKDGREEEALEAETINIHKKKHCVGEINYEW